jgi:hypothetical protein
MGHHFFAQNIVAQHWQKKLDILMVKSDGKKTMIETSVSRLVCPKWHFGQVGQGSKRSKGLLHWLFNKKNHDFF